MTKKVGDFKMGGIAEGLPVVETPIAETPVVETPEVETPEVEAPVVETPTVETPTVETPTVETPTVETPTVETPTVEAPTVEAPVVETPTVETPKIELDPEVEKFKNFKKDYPERKIEDFIALNKDWDKVDDLDILRNKIKDDNTELNLSDSQVDLLIEKKLSIDLSEGIDDLDETEKLQIQIEANKERNSYKKLQQKYNSPLSVETPPIVETPNQVVTEQVKLSSGETIDRKDYEDARRSYLNKRETALSELTSTNVSIDIGTGDDKKILSFDYIYEDADKHSMLSNSEYIPVEIYQMYANEKGVLNHKQLNEDLWWSRPENRNKAMRKMLQSARSKGIEEVLKQETNINFEAPVVETPSTDNKPIIQQSDDMVTAKLHGF